MPNHVTRPRRSSLARRSETRQVENERLANGAGDASRETTEWIDRAHRFAETRRVTFEHAAGSLGGLIGRGEPGAAGRHDQAVEVRGAARASAPATLPSPSATVARSTTVKPRSVSSSASTSPERSSRVPACDGVRDREHLDVERHGPRLDRASTSKRGAPTRCAPFHELSYDGRPGFVGGGPRASSALARTTIALPIDAWYASRACSRCHGVVAAASDAESVALGRRCRGAERDVGGLDAEHVQRCRCS